VIVRSIAFVRVHMWNVSYNQHTSCADRYSGPIWLAGHRRTAASAKSEPSLFRLDPTRRQQSCFAVQRSLLPSGVSDLFTSPQSPPSTVVFGQVLDFYVAHSWVLDGVQPDVWADVYLFQNCDERLLASVLAQLQRDGLESNETTVWLHEQLCVRRTDPTYRLFLPARLLAETVCIVPHPQRWANSKGFSLVLRR
jgi:hypothetical protein